MPWKYKTKIFKLCFIWKKLVDDLQCGFGVGASMDI